MIGYDAGEVEGSQGVLGIAGHSEALRRPFLKVNGCCVESGL